ncbi:response regulator [Halorubrum distributum]|uniref:Response regulator n=1 Tax=Halorubrum distributum JCM 10247 TaxID=1227486 RepID=M0DQS8_9EURY|nr:response regulator [Halorubrum terrestre]ELZ37198.1 response regulator [Halorubrum terrestre JCM 10247]
MADTETDQGPRILVVDDEREVADAYALRLRGECAVETAYGGGEALSTVEDQTVDIVLLDRHMPDISGDEVLETLEERGFEGRVVMVTAIDPGFDVLDLPFDDYLCKPVDRTDIRSVVDHQRRVLAYETLGEYFSAKSTETVLASQTSPEQRENHEEFAAVRERARRLEQRARRLLDDETVLAEFADVDRDGR